MTITLLVMAKAPVAGHVKTRLGADIGMEYAAELAAAALLDTISTCTDFGARHRFLALDGSLADAVRGHELSSRLEEWTVVPQVGDTFAARLVAAHAQVPGPVVQIGMDTPQVTPVDLGVVAAGLATHQSVLAPAVDGGWWALALRDPSCARALGQVAMSTEHTYADTHHALVEAGLSVGGAPAHVDVDTVADAELVAAMGPGEFSRIWARHPNRRTA